MHRSIRYSAALLATLCSIAVLAAGSATARPAAPAPSIVDIALAVNAESGEFSTLIAALQTAGLVETLASRGQYTVFAPTDAAFAEIGLDPQSVTMLPLDVLTNVLLYHVAPGRRDSAAVLGAERIIMLNGDFTFPSFGPGGAFINDAMLLAPDFVDIEATNGIIHVIDAVLMPE